MTTLPLGFFDFADVLLAALVSSNGRHLKSLLYPPHCTLRRSHWRQVGLDSSHFKRLVLQVIQPGEVPNRQKRSAPCALFQNSSTWYLPICIVCSSPHYPFFFLRLFSVGLTGNKLDGLICGVLPYRYDFLTVLACSLVAGQVPYSIWMEGERELTRTQP